MKKITLLISIMIVVGIIIASSFFYFFGYGDSYHPFLKNKDIKVGVLFSETGTMVGSERPVMRAALLAIDQINQHGGIRGQRIIPVVYDGGSDWKKYATLARKMIVEDHVKVIFGCWTSAERKAVKPIVEKYDNLLIYPTQYEGVEESNNIIYLGATPNQQLVPAASWMFDHYGKKVYLVGSDYIYPHIANEILTHETALHGGEVVENQYINLGSTNVDAVIHDIIQKNPDFIFNTINGSTNLAFFKRLSELTAGRRPPVMSFSLSSTMMHLIGTHKMLGDYATWTYFPAENNPENKAFLKAYQAKYGSIQEVNDPAATIFAGVYLWAQAARESPSPQPHVVRNFMLRGSVASPAGVIYVDPVNANAWRTVMIGKINSSGLYDIVWSSYTPIQPIVYPDFKTKANWSIFEYHLYTLWGNTWEDNAHD